MSRGRKSISNLNSSEWESVFYNSVGTYVQYINIQLSKEYKLEPLSNHLKIVGGYAFKTAEYKNQGVPIIRISDFNNEQIILKDVVYYQESKELDKYQLVEGDIIIALTGGTIAKLAIVQNGLGKIYLNQRVGKFQALKPDEFEVEYIYWLARSIQSIIKNLAWGAAIPNVSPKQIEELKFPFPPKETQRGIIDFLNDLKNNDLKEDKIYFDDLIENEIVALHEKQLTASSISTELTHQLTLVKKLRQQLLQDAVQGKLVEQNSKDEPASELLKKIKAALRQAQSSKKGKELPPIKPEEIPFEIPENWVWCRLGEISYAANNGLYKPESFYKDSGYISLRMFNIQDGEVKLDKVKRVVLDDKELINFLLEENDILVNRVNSKELVGKAALIRNVGEPLVFESMNIRLRLANKNNLAPYINLILLESRARFYFYSSAKVANGQVSINQTQLYELIIPLPPLAEQNRIVQKVDELMQYCNELETSIKQSESQNGKLLQQVLREALRKEPVEA